MCLTHSASTKSQTLQEMERSHSESHLTRLGDTMCRRYFGKLSLEQYEAKHVSVKDRVFYQEILDSDVIRQRLSRPCQTILDVGAGTCDLEKILQRLISRSQNCKVIALDANLNILRSGLEIRRILPFTLKIVVADARSCPIKDRTSDITFVLNVTPYIENLEVLACELRRITKGGGLLVLLQPEKCIFWEEEFEGVKLKFHERAEETFHFAGFRLLEAKPINIYPVPGVESIVIRIASLMIFEVRE